MEHLNQLLAKELEKRKKINPRYSLRAYSKFLGISPAQTSQIISGKRKLTLKIFKKVVKHLDISPLEQGAIYREFLKAELGQGVAKNPRLQLQEDQFRIISDWYYFAILALSHIDTPINSFKNLSERLGITSDLTKKAVSRLKKMGIIEWGDKLKQVSPPLQAASEIPSKAIQNFHEKLITMALEKLSCIAPKHREYQSIYLNLTDDELQDFKIYIDQFTDDCQKKATNKANSNLYALNVQLFPINHKGTKHDN